MVVDNLRQTRDTTCDAELRQRYDMGCDILLGQIQATERHPLKQMKPFAGKWRIVEMEVWDQDYVDMEVPGYFRIGSDGTGRFQFGMVSGDIDGQVEPCGNMPRFEFSWSGQDENDPVCGRGWALIENGELNGRIYLHLADDSAFRAIRGK